MFSLVNSKYLIKVRERKSQEEYLSLEQIFNQNKGFMFT